MMSAKRDSMRETQTAAFIKMVSVGPGHSVLLCVTFSSECSGSINENDPNLSSGTRLGIE